MDYWKRQEAIPWVRIHDLPDHAKFPHYSHVNVGLQCQTCHGPVQEMEKVYQFSSLRMGWCIDCHRGEMPLSAAEEAAVRKNSGYVRKIATLAAAGNDVRARGAGVPEPARQHRLRRLPLLRKHPAREGRSELRYRERFSRGRSPRLTASQRSENV